MRHKGVNTSGVPFIFWCLLGISAVVTEYVVAIEKVCTSNGHCQTETSLQLTTQYLRTLPD